MTPVAIWIYEGARVFFANRAACALAGVAREEDLAGCEALDLLTPECHVAFRAHVADALCGASLDPTQAAMQTKLIRARRVAWGANHRHAFPGYPEAVQIAVHAPLLPQAATAWYRML